MPAKINYLELPVADTGAAKAFFGAAFGWTFSDFGPTYAATTGGANDLGLQADPAERTAALLPVIEVDDLEATLAAVWRRRWRRSRRRGAPSPRRSSPFPAAGGSTSAIPTGMSWQRCSQPDRLPAAPFPR